MPASRPIKQFSGGYQAIPNVRSKPVMEIGTGQIAFYSKLFIKSPFRGHSRHQSLYWDITGDCALSFFTFQLYSEFLGACCLTTVPLRLTESHRAINIMDHHRVVILRNLPPPKWCRDSRILNHQNLLVQALLQTRAWKKTGDRMLLAILELESVVELQAMVRFCYLHSRISRQTRRL